MQVGRSFNPYVNFGYGPSGESKKNQKGNNTCTAPGGNYDENGKYNGEKPAYGGTSPGESYFKNRQKKD